jgi:hypothetical protein
MNTPGWSIISLRRFTAAFRPFGTLYPPFSTLGHSGPSVDLVIFNFGCYKLHNNNTKHVVTRPFVT